MKKYLVHITSMVFVLLMIFSLTACTKVNLGSGEIIAVFQYDDADITLSLSDEDAEIVREIFEGKRMFSDVPSCGFNENIALIIDGNTYCIACDSCGTIFSVAQNRYFNLSDEENKILRDLLGEYGFKFPCL